MVTGGVLSLPADNKGVAGFVEPYFACNSAIVSIAPVCFTAEPELSVDALDSVLGARAAGRCGAAASVAEGLLPCTVGF